MIKMLKFYEKHLYLTPGTKATHITTNVKLEPSILARWGLDQYLRVYLRFSSLPTVVKWWPVGCVESTSKQYKL